VGHCVLVVAQDLDGPDASGQPGVATLEQGPSRGDAPNPDGGHARVTIDGGPSSGNRIVWPKNCLAAPNGGAYVMAITKKRFS